MSEYTRAEHFSYYKDTNKETVRERFDTLEELLDFLHGRADDDRILRAVIEWKAKVDG
jgi:hypothetical protein